MSNPYDAVILADSPVSYWPLDEASGTVANDLVGGNNGTYTGGFTLGASPPSSAFGGATTFNGSTGYVTVPDATNLRITGPITLEGWVFYSGLSTGSTNFPTLVQKYDGTTNGYALLNQPHDGGGLQDKPICYLFKSGSLSFQNSPNVMTTGGWHHIVATYDNVNPLIVYVDGVAVVSGNIGANKLGSNTSPLLISNYNQSGDNGFVNGKLAGIAVYNTVLTAAQVLHHYQVGLGIKVFLDGHAAVAGSQGSGTTFPITLTTTLSNDVIVVCFFNEAGDNNTTLKTISSIFGGGLVWAKRDAISVLSTSFNCACGLEVWWAIAASPLSATTITVTLSAATDDYALVAFGVNGCNLAAPWDTDASLPGTGAVASGGVTTITSSPISTTNPNDFIFEVTGHTANNLPGAPGGSFVKIDGANTNAAVRDAGAVAYGLQVTAKQSGLTCTSNGVSSALMIVDALTANVPSVTGNPAALLAHL